MTLRPKSIDITIKPRRDRFEFCLRFHGTKAPISFETTLRGGMGLMLALQRYQEKHRLPIPCRRAPIGRPAFRLVKPEDDE